MINKIHLEKFKRLYLVKYNIELSEEKATELFTQFLTLMKVLILSPKAQRNNIVNVL